MPIVLISCGYLTLMHKEQRFIKNVYGMSFDISEIYFPAYIFPCLCEVSLAIAKCSHRLPISILG